MNNIFSHLTNGFVRNNNVKLKLAILGAPGSGKSTLGAGLLYFCKLFQFKVDFVPEVAKWHVYKGTDFLADNFEYQKFAEQKELEDIYPPELEVTICEAPLIISAIYSRFYRGENDPVFLDMLARAEAYKNRYTHYFVTRKLTPFEQFGRNENPDQSEALHQTTLEMLERLNLNYTMVNRYDEHVPLNLLSMSGAIRKDSVSAVKDLLPRKKTSRQTSDLDQIPMFHA